MTEARALTLAFAVIMLLTTAAYVGLTLANAAEGVLTAVIVVILCAGAHVVSRVVMHYPPPDEHRR